jgi:hypothetical protein
VIMRVILPAGLSTCLVLAACSRPSDSARTVESPRDLRLAEPTVDTRTVSDLEAGRTPPRVARPESTRRPSPTRSAEAVAPTPAHAAMPVAMDSLVSMRVVTRAELPVPMPEVSLPAPSGPALAGPEVGAEDPGQAQGGHRGPMILIRGGMGSPHDDCKIHGLGGLGGLGGGGIAINRVAPPVRGGSGGAPRSVGGTVRIR